MAITSIFARPVFLSTLSLRRATDREFMTIESSKISIHALLAESDERRGQRRPCGISISIHALLAESDGFGPAWLAPGAYFYPRSPCGERHWQDTRNYLMTYFYPRSPCGERLGISACMCITLHIFLSTLSLRRATVPQQENGQAATISIHALLAESDEYWVGGYGTANNFYPRSPCGERHYFCGPAL